MSNSPAPGHKLYYTFQQLLSEILPFPAAQEFISIILSETLP